MNLCKWMMSVSALGFLCGGSAWAEVHLPAMFGVNMVVQHDRAVPVFGTASPGEQVTVTFGAQKVSGVAGADGQWTVNLASMPAGGPLTMTVAGTNTITLANVLIGDVWICSGQSNMAFALEGAENGKQEVQNANDEGLRLFATTYQPMVSPQRDCAGQWAVSSPAAARNFSAVAYFFGQKLRRELKVPVGLVMSAMGGTAIEPWLNRQSFELDPGLKFLHEEFDSAVAKYPAPANDMGWEATGFADSAWKELTQPVEWRDAHLNGDDFLVGVMWLRKEVHIPQDWAGKDLALRFGPIDDGDVAFFNGEKVGASSQSAQTPDVWKTPRDYNVPAKLVKAGRAVVAVKITNVLGHGGILGTPQQMSLAPRQDAGAAPLPLAGAWKHQVQVRWPPGNLTTGLHNGMIAPWSNCAIRGAIWYQGESNAGHAADYRSRLPALIKGWRQEWNQGDFPFLIVQLPGFGEVSAQPSESQWAELREAQMLTASSVPQVGLAVIIDLGEAQNIHPIKKLPVGERLALVALHSAYGMNVPYSGPVYRSMAIEGNRMRLKFDHAQGLRAAGGPLTGFAIGGKDGKLVWADAALDGEDVVVHSDAVAEPVAVRYDWADNPAGNLYNKMDLPAGPFRTDPPVNPGDGL